jgi:hypothetical protein
LSYTDFSSSLHRRPRPLGAIASDIEIYERVIHPYNISAFSSLLKKHSLDVHYPLLINNLTHGFALGDLPALHETVIIPNHPSVAEHPEVVMEYIQTELDAARMSGPYDQVTTEHILRGFFQSSPFIVAVQDQGPGIPPKKRVCRNLSKGDSLSGWGSVNSFIQKEDFPTRFDMAARVAEAVSSST